MDPRARCRGLVSGGADTIVNLGTGRPQNSASVWKTAEFRNKQGVDGAEHVAYVTSSPAGGILANTAMGQADPSIGIYTLRAPMKASRDCAAR